MMIYWTILGVTVTLRLEGVERMDAEPGGGVDWDDDVDSDEDFLPQYRRGATLYRLERGGALARPAVRRRVAAGRRSGAPSPSPSRARTPAIVRTW